MDLTDFRLDISICHTDLAKEALDYARNILQDRPKILGNFEVDSLSRIYRNYSLLEYAPSFALQHLITTSKDAPDPSHALFHKTNEVHQTWLRAKCFAVGNLRLFGKVNIVHVAALLGHAEIVRYYVNSGTCHVDTRDDLKRTPLFYAVFRARKNIMECRTVHT